MSEKKFDTLKHDYEENALQIVVSYGGEGQEEPLYTQQIIEQNTDIDLQGSAGYLYQFKDGSSVKLILHQDQQYYTFDPNQNGWIVYPLDQKIAELQQQYPQQQQQQQGDGQLTLKVSLTDNNTFSKYEGLLTENEIEKLTNKNYDVQSLFDHIKEHVSKALENIEELQLTVGDDFCTLNSILKIQAGRQLKEFKVQCKLNKLKISREDKQDLQTYYLTKLMHKQEARITNLEGKQQKNTENQIESTINAIRQQLQSLDSTVTSQSQQINQTQSNQQNFSQQLYTLEQTMSSLGQQFNQTQATYQQVQQYLQNLESTMNSLSQQINQTQQCYQQVYQQLQQGQQQNKPQTKLVSLSSLKVGDNGYLKTNVFGQGFYEFVAVLQDNDAEFEIGILADGDFEDLEVKAKAFYFEFPKGYFRRGAEDSDKIITYSFQRNTKIGIKVNTNEHWVAASLNGYDFAPISLPQGFENFAYIVKIITEGSQLEDVLEESEQQQQY